MTSTNYAAPHADELRRAWTLSASSLLLGMVIVGAVRDPAGLPLFIRILAPLAGLIYFAATLRLSPLFTLAYLLALFGFVSMLSHGIDVGSIAKYIQVFAMILMAQFVAYQDPTRSTRMIALLLVPIAIVAIPLEVILGEPRAERELFGIALVRFHGLAGLHTQSAFLYMFLAILMVYDRRWLLAVLFVVATLTTGSRGFAAGTLIALLVALTPGRTFKVAAALVVVTLVVSMPFLVWQTNEVLDAAQKFALNVITTRRFDHWVTYFYMGLDHPVFGVGLQKGEAAYSGYHARTYGKFYFPQDSHNLILSIWSEWGVICWALFSAFLLQITVWIGRRNYRDLPILCYLVTVYSFHDGITDWVFWFGLGFLVARGRWGRGGATRVEGGAGAAELRA